MKKLIFGILIITVFTLNSCGDDDSTQPVEGNLTLNITGLEDLGTNYNYEGWIMVKGTPVSTGVFSVTTSGDLSQTSFSIDAAQLADASQFIVSIEPANDTDPAPSATKLLAGEFSGNSANVSSSNIVGAFSSVSGTYILATPTDDDTNNEYSGIWFLDNSGTSVVAGLTLPTLPSGWVYEGWVVFDGIPVSTGTFTDVAMADSNSSSSPYKGSIGNGPNFPGEDYVMGNAAGITFPTDLRGSTVVISIEPSPDNNTAPFTLKPLAHKVPSMAMDHTAIAMGAGPVVSISGVVTR